MTDLSYANGLPDTRWLSTARRKLRRWYRRSARALPWRNTHDPYKIWVSEVMLQQTQVETVIPYFHRYLKAFPSIKRLAAANERDVLRLWEGLGYYRRARQLHAAAGILVSRHQGRFPTTFDEVLALPGIGRYTAGAILSFAFNQRQPILEGNTIRLHTRLLAYEEEPTRAAGQRLLWKFAEAILPRQRCGETNQALMELGSQICQAKQPRCVECPLRDHCAAFARGIQLDLPNMGTGLQYASINEAAVVVRKGNRILLRQCQEGERWAGLWDFPRFAVTGRTAKHLRKELAVKINELLEVEVVVGRHLTQLKHGVTRYRITLQCFEGNYTGPARVRLPRFAKWIAPTALDDYPLSVTGRQISRLLS